MASAKTRGSLADADADGNSFLTFALGPTVGSTSCMPEMSIPPNVRTLRYGVAELTTWRVRLALGGAVYAIASSGTVTECDVPSSVTGMGVTMPPSTTGL